MKTKIAFGLAAIVGMGMLGACDGGSDGADGGAGGDASGGTNNGSGGYAEGSGGNNASGGAEGGIGGGGGEPSADAEVIEFCDKYEDTNDADGFDCGFDSEDTDRYASSEDCVATAGQVAEENPNRFACFVSHLGYVNAAAHADHCAHAHGATLCSEDAYPLP